jgi:hypothetical protein
MEKSVLFANTFSLWWHFSQALYIQLNVLTLLNNLLVGCLISYKSTFKSWQAHLLFGIGPFGDNKYRSRKFSLKKSLI